MAKCQCGKKKTCVMFGECECQYAGFFVCCDDGLSGVSYLSLFCLFFVVVLVYYFIVQFILFPVLCFAGVTSIATLISAVPPKERFRPARPFSAPHAMRSFPSRSAE